jgi:TonB family protein
MTLWLSNLAAYSVQLAVLVGTAAVLTTVLRVTRPRASLRFWQVLFATSVLWPGFQLWANVEGLHDGRAPGVLWTMASASAADMRAGVVAMDTDVAALVVLLLATGTSIRLIGLGLGLIRLRSMCAAAEPAHSLSSLVLPLQHELGVAADIRYSDAVDSPATVGLWRPVILLPRRIYDLTPAVQRVVLCHELLHVRRRDWLPSVLEEVWCASLWFHPAARVLAARLSLARETLVDQATITHTRDRRAYASALLEFSTARPRLLGATALISRRHLEQRIALIAQEVSMPKSSLAVRIVGTVVAVALATVTTTSAVPLASALDGQAEKVYRPDQDTGVTLPRVVHEVKPVYTAAAMQAKIQGAVWLRVVVRATGDVGEVVVAESLDQEHGLDQQAIDAARQWKFEPGTRQGKPVPVEVTVEMRFTLK